MGSINGEISNGFVIVVLGSRDADLRSRNNTVESPRRYTAILEGLSWIYLEMRGSLLGLPCTVIDLYLQGNM